MKNAFIFLLIGGILGAVLFHLYTQREMEERMDTAPASATPPEQKSLPEKARDAASDARDAVSDKLTEWHLTPDDIKNDLAKTGEVVRTKAQAVGEKIDDARIITVIKAKFVLDRDLSARDITVESHDGAVVLGGTVATPGLIGKAVVLALDTDGVHGVVSKINVAAQ